MSEFQLYAQAAVLVDGLFLTQESSVTVARATNSQAVNTVALGYAGESPGAPMVEITVRNAVPSADFELNPGKFMKKMQEVELGILGPGGKQLTARGFIISDNFQHAVNSESSLEFSFRGKMKDWE